MKNSVILALAAILFSGCTKDDNGSFVFHNDYFWYGGEKAPCQPIPNRWYVIIKGSDSARVLNRFKELGYSFGEYSRYTRGKQNEGYPEELQDCDHMTVTAPIDPAEKVEGIVSSGNMYLLPPYEKEWGHSNYCSAILETELQIELMKEYSERLKFYIIDIVDYETFLGVYLACTNRSAGDYVQVANWLHETGKFESVQPLFDKYYIID